MSTTRQRWLIVLLVFAAIILLGRQLREALGIELDVESIRAFAEGLGPAGPVLFIGLVAARSAFALPSQVVLIAAGLCFGTLVGTLVGATGLMLSGLAIFLGVRYAGRESVERRFGARFGRVLEAAGHRAGATFLALGMGYPISPLSPIQAAAGLTPMRVPVFVVAAFVGGTIRAGIFAYFGNAFTETSRMSILYASVGLVLVLASPLLTAGGRRWVRSLLGLGAPPAILGTPAGSPTDADTALHGNAHGNAHGNSKLGPEEPDR